MKTNPEKIDRISKTHENEVFGAFEHKVSEASEAKLSNAPKIEDFLSAIFKDIYPLIAQQIVKRCRIKKGIGIDIGSGPSALAIALAKITDLKIYSLDISERMHEIAKKNIKKEGLNHKIIPITGDVHQLPFHDSFADLITSRGSMFFWKDKETSFREIYRVLKYEGCAYVGDGFGSMKLRDKIKQSTDKNSEKEGYTKIPKISVEKLKIILYSAEIKNYQIINDNSGLWALIKRD